MVSFFVTLMRFFTGIWRGLEDPEFRAMFVTMISLILSGTLFYRAVEGWHCLDALYFSVMTLATVGYGDLNPTTPLSKAFTIFYVLVGAGVFVSFITKLTSQKRARKASRHE